MNRRKSAAWQGAMEALILVATIGGPTMFARISVMRALGHFMKCPGGGQWLDVRDLGRVRAYARRGNCD